MEKWQCAKCEYVYDPQLGDPENNIAEGTVCQRGHRRSRCRTRRIHFDERNVGDIPKVLWY